MSTNPTCHCRNVDGTPCSIPTSGNQIFCYRHKSCPRARTWASEKQNKKPSEKQNKKPSEKQNKKPSRTNSRKTSSDISMSVEDTDYITRIYPLAAEAGAQERMGQILQKFQKKCAENKGMEKMKRILSIYEIVFTSTPLDFDLEAKLFILTKHMSGMTMDDKNELPDIVLMLLGELCIRYIQDITITEKIQAAFIPTFRGQTLLDKASTIALRSKLQETQVRISAICDSLKNKYPEIVPEIEIRLSLFKARLPEDTINQESIDIHNSFLGELCINYPNMVLQNACDLNVPFVPPESPKSPELTTPESTTLESTTPKSTESQ